VSGGLVTTQQAIWLSLSILWIREHHFPRSRQFQDSRPAGLHHFHNSSNSVQALQIRIQSTHTALQTSAEWRQATIYYW